MKKIHLLILSSFFSILILFSLQAGAQDNAQSFSIRNFQASPGINSFITVEGASVPKGLHLKASALFNYQYHPLVIRQCNAAENNTCTDWSDNKDPVISHKVDGEILGALAIGGIFEAGIAIPVVMYQKAEGIPGASTPSESINAGGLEDLRLHLKLDILGGLFHNSGGKIKASLALIPVITFPIGNAVAEDSFMGDSFLTVHPKVAFGMETGRIRMGINAGYLIAKEKETYLATVGSAITYGGAVDIETVDRLGVIIELFGKQAVKKDLASAPLEIIGGVHYDFDSGLGIMGGLGAAILPGVGSPPFRVFAGISYTSPDKQRKHKKSDGALYNENGEEEQIKPPDWDEDNIMDANDKCPESPEDYDGFEDEDGCPDDDNDGDMIMDKIDKCPEISEDFDNFQDDDGCPELDNDMDGVPDKMDKCPDSKETFNSIDDSDGCADKGRVRVEYSKNEILLLKPLSFKAKDTEISGKTSTAIMDMVYNILNMNKELTIEVQSVQIKNGEKIIESRLNTVKKYLADKGVDESRLKTSQTPSKAKSKSNIIITIK
ncbi:MAG: hypothetical protein JXR91_15365 [Deltaproteobacteria bacterium]|nr:hypothetical protein [Deltaproteobacteria bacterium]